MSDTVYNIILADDDEDDRMLFSEALEEVPLKAKLSLFKNGQELLDYLFQPNIELPNLIFLDINMPFVNGIQCLTEIRSNPNLKDLFIAMYSTSSSEKDIKESFDKGANMYINKPSCFNKLCEMVEKTLKVNWKNHNINLNKDTFLFRI